MKVVICIVALCLFVGWDQPKSGYACLWLDVTGGGGLSAEAIGHAKPAADELAFVFNAGDGSVFYKTFTYKRDTDILGLDNRHNKRR